MIALHTGSCLAAPRATTRGATAPSHSPGTTYCLHDASGRPVGTIAAPALQPITGPFAPTFYLRRSS